MQDRRRTEDIAVNDYLTAFRRRWYLVLLPALIGALVAYGLLGRGSDRYRSDAEVLLGSTAAQAAFDPAADAARRIDRNFVANEVRFARTDSVHDEVQQRLAASTDYDEETIEDATDRVNIRADSNADLLTFELTTTDPDLAALLVNTYTEVYVSQRRDSAVGSYSGAIAFLNEQISGLEGRRSEAHLSLSESTVTLARIDPDDERRASDRALATTAISEANGTIDSLDLEISSIRSSLSELTIASRLAATGTATIASIAVPSEEAIPSGGPQTGFLGFVLGALIGALAAVVVDRRDDRLRTTEDVTAAVRLPILGALPKPTNPETRELEVLRYPNSLFTESIYGIRSSIRFIETQRDLRTIVITSSRESEGKTTVAANLAWSLAGIAEHITLVDSDLRRSTAHSHFGVDLGSGITDIVLGDSTVHKAARAFEEKLGSFTLFSAGNQVGNPADFASSRNYIDTITDLGKDSLVIVDAAPLLPVSDTRSLAASCDLTIVVVKLGATRRRELLATTSLLASLGAGEVAIVVTGAGEYEQSSYHGDSAYLEAAKNGSSDVGPVTPTEVSENDRSIDSSMVRAANNNGKSDATIETVDPKEPNGIVEGETVSRTTSRRWGSS